VTDPNTPTPVVKAPAFPPTSRYYGVETTSLLTADGRTVAYLRRRFVPPPDRFGTLAVHVVAQGDRIDTVTAAYLGDPDQFWRVCDANGAVRPAELVEEPGRVVRIGTPEGVPGGPGG
jgi:hypothetical protein